MSPRYPQPSDETPLPSHPNDPVPNVPPFTPSPEPTSNAVFDNAEREVGQAIAGGYRQTDAAITDTINYLRDTLGTATARTSRTVNKAIVETRKPIEDTMEHGAAVGIPQAYGRGVQQAELADPTGQAIVDRVLRTMENNTPPASALPPAATDPSAAYSGGIPAGSVQCQTDAGGFLFCQRWNGLAWIPLTNEEIAAWQDDGSPPIWNPSQPTSPPPSPPTTPPVPPTVPPPLPPTSPPPPIPPVPPPPPIESPFPECPPEPPVPPVPPGCTLEQYGYTTDSVGEVHYDSSTAGRWKCTTRYEVVCPPPVPPVPPTVPPVPVPPTCPPDQVWNPVTQKCEPKDTPTTGHPTGTDGGPLTGGQCCPPQTINVPPVTIKYPDDKPANPKPVGTAAGPAKLSSVDWDKPSTCGTADSLLDGLDADDRQLGRPEEPIPAWMSWFKLAGGYAQYVFPEAAADVAKSVGEMLADNAGLSNVIGPAAVGSFALASLKSLRPGDSTPHFEDGFALAIKLGLVNRAESLTGAPMSYMYQATTYLYQYLNPQYILKQPDIDELYVRGKITEGYWECLTRANGNLPELHALARSTRYSRPIDSEIIQLRLRGIIKTDEEFTKRMREVGYVDPAHAIEKLKLASWVPGPSDLERYMVRDAADDEVARLYDYDKDFTTKFSGPIKEWAKAQGITEDVFKYHWRSHWVIPSNTQLYSMLHRLRPDRADVVAWDQANAGRGLPVAGDPDRDRPPIVTRADVRRALEINDVAPAWVEPLIEISYHPLTNTDARRAYEIGFFNEEQLTSVMLDNGYKPADARTLTDYFKAEREKRIGASTGVLSARRILQAYKAGEMEWSEAFSYLADYFPDANVRRRQLDKANIEFKLEVRRDIIKGIKKGYVFGEYDDIIAEQKLLEAGVPLAQIGGLIDRFRAAKIGHRKEPRVQMLCQWFTHRLITQEEYYVRLGNLGYTSQDAARIAQVCGLDQIVKERTAAAKALEKANREAKAEVRNNLAELRREVKELEERKKELERALAGGG